VSVKIGRHFWRHPAVPFDAEWRDQLGALHRAVDEKLTARQHAVFIAIVLNGVPLDRLVIELASNRNAIYKPCSTPGVSCGRRLPLMGIYLVTL
jgi:RNA polymerase sigma-70 factor (ECF subfamily)